MKESGKIRTNFCCVDKRQKSKENDEDIIIIHGHFC